MFFEERVLQYIFTIATEENISKAAEKLYVAQPTLSKFLHNVEKKLNAKLFVRGKKTLTLTPAGIKYLEYLKKVEALNKEYALVISQMSAEKKTSLKVGCGSITSPLLSKYVFAEFQKQHPHVRITLVEDVHIKLLKLLKAKALDVAMLVGQTTGEPYVKDAPCDTIVEGVRLMAAGLNHPLAKLVSDLSTNSVLNPTKIKPEALSGQVLIAGIPGQKQYHDLRFLVKKYGLMGTEFVSTKNVLTGISMAACNLGLFFFPDYYFKKFALEDKLVYFSLDVEEKKWSLVLQQATNTNSPVLADFVHLTKKRLG